MMKAEERDPNGPRPCGGAGRADCRPKLKQLVRALMICPALILLAIYGVAIWYEVSSAKRSSAELAAQRSMQYVKRYRLLIHVGWFSMVLLMMLAMFKLISADEWRLAIVGLAILITIGYAFIQEPKHQ